MQRRQKHTGPAKFPLWATTPGWEFFLIGVAAILAMAFLSEVGIWLVSVVTGGG